MGGKISAQVSAYAFSQSTGTYSEITGGTVLGSAASDDEVFNNNTTGQSATITSTGFPIGFNFVLDGVTFDKFAVNNNGWIKLGTGSFAIGGTSVPLSETSTTAHNHVIAGMATDMLGQAGSELSYTTVGSAPNRKLIVQWKNYKRWTSPASAGNLNFQIVLSETSNKIEIIYGTNTVAVSNTAQVGIKGPNNTHPANVNNRTSTTDWSATTSGTSNSSSIAISSTVNPASGLIFTWSPPTCVAPAGLAISGVTTTGATLTWNASPTTPSAYEYYLSPINTAPTAGTEPTDDINGLTTNVGGLTANTPYYVWIRSNCGGGDMSVWSGPVAFTTLCDASPLTYTSGFNATTIPACWSRQSLGIQTGTKISFVASASNKTAAPQEGTHFVMYNSYSSTNGGAGAEERLISAPLTSTGISSVDVEFYWFQNNGPDYAFPAEGVTVEWSTNGGTTWNTETYYPRHVATAPVAGVWSKKKITLPAGAGNQTSLLVALKFHSEYGYNMYVDNFTVRETPQCAVPTLNATTEITKNSATINWTAPDTGIPTAYEYVVTETAGTPAGAGTETEDLSVDLTSLDPSTMYYVYVRTVCTDIFSEWTLAGTFTTMCDYPDILTTEDGTACGQGEVELSATSSGGILNWYTAQTGGSLAGTGATFTTPLLTETTDYFVEAVFPANVNVGPNYSGTGDNDANTGNHGLRITTTKPNTTINSLDMVFTGTGTITIAVRDNNNSATIATYTSAEVIGISPAAVTLPVNLTIPAAGDYTLIATALTGSVNNMGYTATGNTYPYTTPDGSFSITSTYWYGTDTTNYLYFYNLNVTAGCASPRTMVTATVTDAPDIEVEVTEPVICSGESTEISVESSNAGYTYVWMPGNLTGATQTVSPTATTTYTVTAIDETTECVEVAEITVTVNQLPTIVTPMADMEVCEAGIEELTFDTSFGGTVISGTDTTASVAQTTATTLGPNPLQNYWGGAKQQWIYTAAELTAMGFVEGSSITSFALDLATGNAAPALTDLTVKMKNVAQGSFATTTSWITEMTTVRNAANYVPAAGWNTFNLDTPFTWDGSSNIAIQMSFSNNNAPTTGTNSARYSATSFPSTIYYRADNTLPAAMESFTGTATATYNQRNNVQFNFSNPVETTWAPITNLWLDANATTPYVGGPAGTVYTKPVAAITYTATATTAAGCSVSDSASITINVIDAPDAMAEQSFCNSGTVTDMESDGTDVKWYYEATGGSSLAETVVLLDGTTYYASQTVDGCESVARTAVTVEINVTDAPEASEDVYTFCNAATLADVEVDGENIMWYADAMGGDALASDMALEEGITLLFASQTVDGCESQMRAAVVVELNMTDAPMIMDDAPVFCNSATLADIQVEGENVIWYADEEGGEALASDMALENEGMYYASQTINGCESAARTMVMVSINAPAEPTGDDTQEFCYMGTVGDIEVDGAVGNWYDAAEGGNMLAMDTPLVDGTMYYASQIVDGCESIARFGVTVTIDMPMADAPENVTACFGYELPELNNGNYYTDSNGAGEMLPAGTVIVETTDLYVYYVSGGELGCTAENMFTVTINEALLEGETTQVVEVNAGEAAVIADLMLTGDGTITWYASEADAMNGENALSGGFEITDGVTYWAVLTNGDCTSDPFSVTVDVVLGRDGFDSASFTYYPNPVNDVLNMSYSEEISSVKVFNMLGQEVMSILPNANDVKLNMASLSDATYIVNVTSGDSVKTVKVVKKQ